MKISRSLAAVALSGTLLLGGTTVAIAQIPDAADNMEGIPLPETFDVDGVTYIKKTKTGSDGEAEVYYESVDGSKQLTALQVKDLRDKRDAAKEEESESETSTSETTSAEASESETTTTTKTTEPAGSETSKTTEPSESPTSSSETSSSKPADGSEESSTSATTSESESAEPTPTKTAEPGDKKSSVEDALSSKDGKPTPLAIFGIVAGVLAAVAAAFPAIAKALNLNIKLPF